MLTVTTLAVAAAIGLVIYLLGRGAEERTT